MANQLVPYIQDEQKWIKHYLAQAQKQIKPKEMMMLVKEKPAQPSIVLPTMQLGAQAESELKHQQNEAPVFAPVKATPEFESTHSSSVTAKGRTTTKTKCITKGTTQKEEEENHAEEEKVTTTFKRHFQLIINHG